MLFTLLARGTISIVALTSRASPSERHFPIERPRPEELKVVVELAGKHRVALPAEEIPIRATYSAQVNAIRRALIENDHGDVKVCTGDKFQIRQGLVFAHKLAASYAKYSR